MIEIKTITDIEEMKKTVQIQKSAWGFKDVDVEPHFVMTRVQKYGGLIQALYYKKKCIGFTYALIGKWEGNFFIYSHMTAVAKEYQGKGFGFLLKKAQREEVLKMGYTIIRWNFDPLESLNAYFNFHRLGVFSTEYERNIYGEGESGLHKGLPTDRLIATWELDSETVQKRMKSKELKIVEDIPENKINHFNHEVAYIEIPRDIRDLKEKNKNSALEWRLKTRELFELAFEQKWIARDIVYSKNGQRLFCRLFKK